LYKAERVLKIELVVAKSLGNDQFKVSTGWLDSFKKMRNIVWNTVCGEAKDVDESVVSEYKPNHMNLKTFTMQTKQDCFLGITNKITRG
jgi:hypothetical protein